MVCAFCQTLMWRAICLAINPRVGLFFIAALVFSPGNFHSSAAYLPSSFAMYMAMLGAAAFINWRGGLKTSQGMFWFAVGGVFGWPFAIALCAPFVFEEGLLALFGDGEARFETAIRVVRGVTATFILVVRYNPTLSRILLIASAKVTSSSISVSTPSSTEK